MIYRAALHTRAGLLNGRRPRPRAWAPDFVFVCGAGPPRVGKRLFKESDVPMSENEEALAPEQKTTVIQSLKAAVESYGISWHVAAGAVGAVGLLLAVCLVFSGMVIRRNSAEKKAAELSRQFVNARGSADMQALLDRNRNSRLSPLILLKLAQTQFAEGGYERAQSTYQAFLNKYPDHPLVLNAEFGMICCVEAGAGEIETASGLYKDFAGKYTNSHLMAPAILGQARCLEQMKKWEEAGHLYEEFLAGHTNSLFKAEFENRLKDAKLETRRAKGTL